MGYYVTTTLSVCLSVFLSVCLSNGGFNQWPLFFPFIEHPNCYTQQLTNPIIAVYSIFFEDTIFLGCGALLTILNPGFDV